MDYFTLALSAIEKLLDHLPNYEQRKRDKFFKLKKEYVEEINKEYYQRDDDKVLNLRDELIVFLESFQKEISK